MGAARRAEVVGWERVVALTRTAAEHGAQVAVAARAVGSDRTWRHDGDRPFPAASTIKLAVLVALFQEVDAGRLDLERLVPVVPGAVVGGSGVLAWLRPGLALPVADLAYLMIAISDNTASNLLIDLIGIERVGAAIAGLGLAGTALNRRFLGRTPGSGEPENVTTAADLVALLSLIAGDRAASPASCARMRELLTSQQDRDRLARRLPPGVDFGGKSGSLPGLAHDAGLLGTPGGSLAVAVLTRGFADPYAAHELIGQIARALVDEAFGGPPHQGRGYA